MVIQDPWQGVALGVEPSCTDRSDEEANSDIVFQNGQSNELMVLRACAKIEPMFPTTGLGKALANNSEGQYALTSTTVFVQEPL